jgi:DNA invertase Pin-like site-specific DNA recombinase
MLVPRVSKTVRQIHPERKAVKGIKGAGLAGRKTEAMKYGYARVSTDDQNPALQLAALKKTECTKIFKDEGKSGAVRNRPALSRCLKKLEPGDTLIVWKLDRLGRSLRDLIIMLDDLKQRGVKFCSVTQAIDTDTPTGRAMWQMIGVLAELERSLISERTRAGVKAARDRGVKFGRKRKLSREQIDHARKLIQEGHRRENVANLLNVNRTTLYQAIAV